MELEIDVSDGMKKTSPSKRTERRNFSSYPGKNKKSLSLLPSAVGIISNNDGQHIEREKKKKKDLALGPGTSQSAPLLSPAIIEDLCYVVQHNHHHLKITADATKLDRVYIIVLSRMSTLYSL
jgi:hypothetical protein